MDCAPRSILGCGGADVRHPATDLWLLFADRVFDGRGKTTPNPGVAITGSAFVSVRNRSEFLAWYATNGLVEEFPGATLLPGLIGVHSHLLCPARGSGGWITPIGDHGSRSPHHCDCRVP
jgi:hypothetical protein